MVKGISVISPEEIRNWQPTLPRLDAVGNFDCLQMPMTAILCSCKRLVEKVCHLALVSQREVYALSNGWNCHCFETRVKWGKASDG